MITVQHFFPFCELDFNTDESFMPQPYEVFQCLVTVFSCRNSTLTLWNCSKWNTRKAHSCVENKQIVSFSLLLFDQTWPSSCFRVLQRELLNCKQSFCVISLLQFKVNIITASEGIVIGFKRPEDGVNWPPKGVKSRTNIWVKKHGVVQLVETIIITECVLITVSFFVKNVGTFSMKHTKYVQSVMWQWVPIVTCVLRVDLSMFVGFKPI
jgi:hypothetical protein